MTGFDHMGIDDKKLSAEMAELEDIPFIFEMPCQHAFIIHAQIQLALRHPRNQGPSSDIAKHIASCIEKVLSEGRPEIAKLFQIGWNPEYDV